MARCQAVTDDLTSQQETAPGEELSPAPGARALRLPLDDITAAGLLAAGRISEAGADPTAQLLWDDIARVVRHGTALCLKALAGAPLRPCDLAFLSERASAWMKSGLSMRAVLVGLRLTSQAVWARVARHADPGQLATLSSRFLVAVHKIHFAVSQGARPAGDPRQALAYALVHGRPVPPEARAAAGRAHAFTVVVVGSAEGVGAATGRRVGELLPCALRLTVNGALVLLLPCEEECAEGHHDAAVARIHRAAWPAGSEPFSGVVDCVPREKVHEAVGVAREVLRIAEVIGRDPGSYRLIDVAMEYSVLHTPDATRAVGKLLEPLSAHSPDLLHTLRSFLSCGMDRRRTAGSLHVHPNTVDYRLRRIHELTTVSPTTPHGAQLLSAALAVAVLS
ncbi:PucR family transcriptional regulator [Streptomyces cinnamoneus]|uniref:PucR family transcriptional regulator n=1 Tax=Streptomyces cinnamoneus TaxID=53446 RepID=UPI003795DD38